MTIGHFQTNFSRGQLSTKLDTRIDTEAYRNGAGKLENMLVFLQGGARARPGTLQRARLEDVGGNAVSATGCRLERMQIDRDEAYAVVFTDGQLDIYRLTASGVTHSQRFTGAKWDATSMDFMTVKAHGNIVVICDQTFHPQLLTRTGLDSFTLEDFPFATRVDGNETYQPYHKYEGFETTVELTHASEEPWDVGTGRTATASDALFVADHVGKTFLMRDGQFKVSSISDSKNATVEVIRQIRTILDPNPFTCHKGNNEVTVTFVGHGLKPGDTINVKNSGDASGAGISGNDINGDRGVMEVIDADRFIIETGDSYDGEDGSSPGPTNATDTMDFGGSDVWIRTASATRDWQEPAFSDHRGYPQTCETHEGRLWFAGPPGAGGARWGSRSGNFFNFNLAEGEPDAAIKAVEAVYGGQIRHLVSGSDLEVLSETGEAFMPSGLDEPITPDNVRSRNQTRIGSGYTPPVRFDGSTLFVDAIGLHVREFLYNENADSYVAPPVTALAADLISKPFHATTFNGAKGDATPYVVYTNDDGSAAFFHSSRQEGIAGWTRQTTNGDWESFLGIGERLFCVATRAGEIHLEEWDFDYEARADGCETLTSGAATTDWQASLAHLKSATVDVFRDDGTYLEQVSTDASGNFTTATSETDIIVGLPASWSLETLPPSVQLQSGPTLGRRHHIAEAIVFFTDTTKAKVGKTVKTFSSPKTGPFQFRQLGWSRDPIVPCSGSIAEKATISGIRAEVG